MPHYETAWVEPALNLAGSCGDLPYFKSVDVSDFGTCDCQVSFAITEEMRSLIQRLASERSTSQAAVGRAILFEALYGVRRYYELLEHLRRTAQLGTSVQGASDDDVKFSRSRFTQIDLKHLGKADIVRQLSIPRKMADDLEIVAKGTGYEISQQVRHLMFRLLVGKRRADRLMAARKQAR